RAFGSAPSLAPARMCAPSMSIPPPQSSRPKFPPRWIGSRRGCCQERTDEPPPVHPQREAQLVARASPLRRLHGARVDQLVRRPLLRPARGGALAPGAGPRGVGRLLGRVVQPAWRAVPTPLSGVCRLSQRDLVRPDPKAMPLALRGEPVPAKAIVGMHYGAWALVSLIVLIAAGI